MTDVKIDSTNTTAWADSWVKKYRAAIPEYKKEGTSEFDLRCDMFMGDLPWTETENRDVLDKIRAHLDFPLLLSELKDAFQVTFLEETVTGEIPA